MSNQACCCASSDSPPENRSRRVAACLLPAVGLALVPKCPMCVAAWVSLMTGVSLSLQAASWLRGGMLAVCVGLLGLLVVRLIPHVRSSRSI